LKKGVKKNSSKKEIEEGASTRKGPREEKHKGHPRRLRFKEEEQYT